MSPEVISMREPDEPMTSERVLLSSGRYVLFGPFRIDQQRQEVTRNGTRLKLQGKVYQVLLTLLEKPGDVVTREELRMRLWPADTHVNYDANVTNSARRLAIPPISRSTSRLFPGRATASWCSPKSPTRPPIHSSPRARHPLIPLKKLLGDWSPFRFQSRMFGLCSA